VSGRDLGASVRQRLLNQARSQGRPFQELLQYFAMERFLYRLATSPFANRPEQIRFRIRIGRGRGASTALRMGVAVGGRRRGFIPSTVEARRTVGVNSASATITTSSTRRIRPELN
jgi:hypothetical protein